MNDLKFNEQKQIEPRFDEQPKPAKKMEAITMNELKLNKQHEPEFEELSRMLCDLRNFLSIESDFNDAGYRRNLEALINFQDDDGSFKLFDSYRIPGDARVDFCYIPTYISTAILRYGLLYTSESEVMPKKSPLHPYMQLVNLPEFIRGILTNDMDGIILNENSQNITIPREFLLHFLRNLENPDFNSYEDYAFPLNV